ncbi:MAG: amidohydrolase family protein [Verrucomicrobia bacterium]|nr:amidohydrolase family protein [Verrucomicrobiota bacterium]
MLLRARHLLPISTPPIENGALRIRAGQIAEVGRWEDLRAVAEPGEEVVDLGEQTVLPGLINAHCHLDYTGMRGAILPPESFSAWIGRINALKRELTDDDYLRAIESGFAQCLQTGTTALVNIEAFPELMPRLATPPLRTWWCYELIDIRQRIATDDVIRGALSFFQHRTGWLGGFGLSPHAPYTASAELYRLARAAGRVHGMPVTTHLAESQEEQDMFLHACGPLHDFLRGLGRPMEDCGQGESALTQLQAKGALDADCLVAHLNLLTSRDESLLAPGAPLHGLSVVHCPSSHAYFRHPEFPAERLRALGANLCLGTDSLASAASLDLRAELRLFAARHPGQAPIELLELVTTHPATALRAGGRLGCLAPGAAADLLVLPLPSGGDPLEAAVHAVVPPSSVWVAGRKTWSAE